MYLSIFSISKGLGYLVKFTINIGFMYLSIFSISIVLKV